MGRAPCCDKANVKKGPWSPEEDAKLKSYIDQHGTGGNWIALPQKIGLKRCGKSCRLRWLNYLRPNIKHGGFSEEEDNIICNLYISIGSRWSIIAAQLPGRTDNDIKNYWNTRLKKKLLGRQRKEQAMAAHQARRRRPNNFSPKQEIIMKREIVNSQGSPNFDDDNTSPIIDHHHHHHHHLQSRFASSYHVMSQADHQAPNYWPPELPLAMPAAQESDQQASLKNLLAKLGGRFSEGSATACNYAFPAADHDHHLMVSSAQDQAYQASKFDVLASSTSLYGGGESSSGHQSMIFQLGLENLQAELSELINYSNYQQADDQLVGDYGANYSGGFTSANSTTSLDSSSSSLVNYHSNNMVSDQHYSQFHQDNSAFDQVSSCYFGSAYDNITI